MNNLDPKSIDSICKKIDPEEIWNATKPREYRKKTEQLALRLNHWLFKWYYKRVDTHFWQWTFIKSVKLLIHHYDHEQILHKNANANFRGALNELDATRKELYNLRMQQIATPGQIDILNKAFGMDYDNPKDN